MNVLTRSFRGELQVYNIASNQISGSAFLGTVGVDWTFAGVAPISAPAESDLVLRNDTSGALQAYNNKQKLLLVGVDGVVPAKAVLADPNRIPVRATPVDDLVLMPASRAERCFWRRASALTRASRARAATPPGGAGHVSLRFTHRGLTRVHAQTRAANQMQILTPKPASHRTMLPVKTGPRRTRYPKAYVITGTASKTMIAHLL
jgi:hypothetical protein